MAATVYGLNFGAPDIPPSLRRGVRERRRKLDGVQVPARGTVAILVGCTNNNEVKNLMTIQATNGHRKLYWEVNLRNGWHYVWAYY